MPESVARQVLQALREPAALIGADGTVRAVNAAWEGLSRSASAPPVVSTAVGGSILHRCRTAHLAGFEPGQALARSIDDLLHGRTEELDLELEWTASGILRRYLVTGTRLPDGTGAVLVHRDVTAQKLAQDALGRSWDFYLRLFDDFPALIWRAGPDGRHSFFNRTWLEFTGQALAHELGMGFLEGVHPEDREGLAAALKEAMADLSAVQIEFRLRRRDSDWRTLVASGRPYHDMEGKFAGYVFVGNDITGARRAEDEARRARHARTELMDRELGQLDEFRAQTQGELSPLSTSQPEVFERLCRRYGELVELALERRVFGEVAPPSEGLKELAHRLAELRAGPRDVIDMHTCVVKEKSRHVAVPRREAYQAEARLVVLELMGHLVNSYRAREADRR